MLPQLKYPDLYVTKLAFAGWKCSLGLHLALGFTCSTIIEEMPNKKITLLLMRGKELHKSAGSVLFIRPKKQRLYCYSKHAAVGEGTYVYY